MPSPAPPSAHLQASGCGDSPPSDFEIAQRLQLHYLACSQGSSSLRSTGLDLGTLGATAGGCHVSARSMLASQLLQELLTAVDRSTQKPATAGERNSLLLECRKLLMDDRASSGLAGTSAGVLHLCFDLTTICGRNHRLQSI